MIHTHIHIRSPPSSRGSNSPAIRFGANSQATGDPGNEGNDYRTEVPEQHLSRDLREIVRSCLYRHVSFVIVCKLNRATGVGRPAMFSWSHFPVY